MWSGLWSGSRSDLWPEPQAAAALRATPAALGLQWHERRLQQNYPGPEPGWTAAFCESTRRGRPKYHVRFEENPPPRNAAAAMDSAADEACGATDNGLARPRT